MSRMIIASLWLYETRYHLLVEATHRLKCSEPIERQYDPTFQYHPVRSPPVRLEGVLDQSASQAGGQVPEHLHSGSTPATLGQDSTYKLLAVQATRMLAVSGDLEIQTNLLQPVPIAMC
ncbi:hypothetical protein IG631_23955 [Alternaria alternata]|nr:hypothetical protein IG631_23955 [Alternaria alternata]